jgi:PAS domain S-box-containing protein
MERHGRKSEKASVSVRHGWSLRHYMSFFMVALLAVAVVAAIAVRSIAEQDARQAAQGDANFAARVAASEIANELSLISETTAKLAANPQVPSILASPIGPCSLTFGGGSLFSAGHLDIVKPDGSVKCSSMAFPTGTVYGAAPWLAAAINGQVTSAPFMDPLTGQMSTVVASPVAGGIGIVLAVIALAPLGPNLAATLGGPRHLEFIVTTADTRTALARSVDPTRWVGANVASTAFAHSPGQVERPDVTGTARLYGKATVAPTAWVVYAGADAAAALSAADLSANRGLAIIAAGVAVMLVVAFVVYRRVAQPVRQLSLVMRGAIPGDAVNAVSSNGALEVTGLARDFDALMTTVKEELAVRLTNEQAAIESESNYRMLFQGHPQPMWLYDVDTLAFLDVNDSAVDKYGYSRDEFLAMKITDIRPPQDVPKLLEIVAKPLPAFDKTGPWRHLLKNGTTVQVLVTSHATRFADHNARFVLAEDLSESHRLELELHRSQARAESTAELSRAKDEMVSMVSHEMRTPLASIVGFTELLVTREVSPDQRKDYLAVMLQEGHRLTALINDFLDLRRIEGGHLTMRFAPADVTALIKRAVDLFSDPAHSPIETRLPDDLPLVRADSDSIFRVVANLLSNARKYSPNGGAIVVSAGLVEGMVEVSIEDEGLGIPADAVNHLFHKFYRIDTADRRTIKGTGLGLAISKNIVEAHGGKISASSAGAGHGSRFFFTIPMVRDQAQTGDVLVVEDDSGFAHLLEAELSGRGMSSVWAPDAETAEHLMTNKGARAVVLDLLLPGLSGEAFLQRLRKRHGPHIPVVVVTLKDLDPAESLALQKAGVTAVLRKGPGMAEAAANLIAKSLVADLVAS